MKRLFTIIIVLALCLSSLGFMACGGNDKSPSSTIDASSSQTGNTTQPAAQNQSSVGSLSWDDMPLYSGAKQMQKGSWAIPASENEEYSKFEWRYYEVNASSEEVAAFYKDKMTSIGWTEAGWMEVQGTSWGMYNKNNENDAAMVWISTQDNNTVIAMWRATK
jgi:hypothetical protein